MTHTYLISGMTCGNCVAKAKSQFLTLENVTEANIQLTTPQATITMQKHIPLIELQNVLSKAGNYKITEADAGIQNIPVTEETISWIKTYKPIILIGMYISGITLLVEAVKESFHGEIWMQNFMGAFFLVFSFFKMLNLKGFAESYSTYDIIAKRWFGWAYVYAFLELGLGLAYLLNLLPLITNAVTFVVMSISIVGVFKAVLNKRKIKCACLGTVFNLPMSTVTIVEDSLMLIMSFITILTLV